MKPLTCDEMCRVLERDGWLLVRTTKHHNYMKMVQDRKVVVQVPRHGRKTLRTATQADILDRAGISQERLSELL